MHRETIAQIGKHFHCFWEHFHGFGEHFHGSVFSVHFLTEGLKYFMVIGENLAEDLGSKFCGSPQGNSFRILEQFF